MVEIIDGWRCIGCGKVDAPRPCIGVCTDKRVQLVLAEDYAEAVYRVEQLEEALALIARITPKADKLEASWLALQARAKQLLDEAKPLY
jgi:acyl carrier protein phosphodiesterase